MLLLLIIITLVTQAVAQDNSTFDPNSVDLSTKNQWCKGQTSNCPTLCGGQSQTEVNTCTGSSLDYNCTCSNGTGPANIAQYEGTLPNFICEAAFAQCRTDNPGSDSCETCGTLQPSNVAVVAASTSSPSSTAVDQIADGTIVANPTITSTALATSIPTTSLAISTTTTPSSTTAERIASENRTASKSAASHPAAKASLNTKSTTQSSEPSSNPSAASSGLPTPTKIGIGVGIPLGFFIFASTIFLAYRFGQRKQRTEPKRESYPTAAVGDGEKRTGDGHDSWVGYVPELHGAEIPLYSRELEGSLAQRRQELP